MCANSVSSVVDICTYQLLTCVHTLPWLQDSYKKSNHAVFIFLLQWLNRDIRNKPRLTIFTHTKTGSCCWGCGGAIAGLSWAETNNDRSSFFFSSLFRRDSMFLIITQNKELYYVVSRCCMCAWLLYTYRLLCLWRTSYKQINYPTRVEEKGTIVSNKGSKL